MTHFFDHNHGRFLVKHLVDRHHLAELHHLFNDFNGLDAHLHSEISDSVSAAGGLSVTFHRAFDMTSDPVRALEEIIALGCDRILTSGCAPTAEEGTEMLRRLNETAAGRIIILGGCGVSPSNAAAIIASTGLTELHASARSSVESLMAFRNSNVAMGAAGSDEFSRKSTDISKVRQLAEILHKI